MGDAARVAGVHPARRRDVGEVPADFGEEGAIGWEVMNLILSVDSCAPNEHLPRLAVLAGRSCVVQYHRRSETMTLELQLSTEIEAKLRQRATTEGVDLADFVLRAVAEKLADADSKLGSPAPNAKEWGDKLRKLIELHPTAASTVDDSRDSIYAGRGE